MFGYVKKKKVFDALDRELRIYDKLTNEAADEILCLLDNSDSPIERSESGDETIRTAIDKGYTLEGHRYYTREWPLMWQIINDYNHWLKNYRTVERSICMVKNAL